MIFKNIFISSDRERLPCVCFFASRRFFFQFPAWQTLNTEMSTIQLETNQSQYNPGKKKLGNPTKFVVFFSVFRTPESKKGNEKLDARDRNQKKNKKTPPTKKKTKDNRYHKIYRRRAAMQMDGALRLRFIYLKQRPTHTHTHTKKREERPLWRR